MNISKKDILLLIEKTKRTSLIFLILSIVFFAGAAGLIIAGCCFLKPNNNLAVNLIYYGTMCAALGITFIVLRSVLCTTRLRALQEALKMFEGKEVIKVGEVDVRDANVDEQNIPIVEPENNVVQQESENKENALIKEYEKLVEQGLITQEDFEKRKKDILGK